MPGDTVRYAMNTPQGDSSGGDSGPGGTITDPTGGAPNFNIYDVFKSFGYTPSQQEIDSLAPAFEGRTNIGQTGTSAVAEYVQAHQQLKGAQSLIQGNLLSEQEAAKNAENLSTIYQQQGEDAYNKAADIYTQAPKLFGQFSADATLDSNLLSNDEALNAYLAPLRQQLNYGLGQATGATAQRGLSGSSIEGNAIGQQLGLFGQNVLSTGLGLGVNQQANQAAVLQALGQQKYGAANTQTNAGLGYRNLSNTSAGQNYTAAADITGLAGTSVNMALQQQAALRALNAQNQSFGSRLLGGLENSAIADVNAVASLPATGIAKLVGGPPPGVNQAPPVSPTGQAMFPQGGFMGAPPVDPTGGLATAGGADAATGAEVALA